MARDPHKFRWHLNRLALLIDTADEGVAVVVVVADGGGGDAAVAGHAWC